MDRPFVALALFGAAALVVARLTRRARRPLPPGPKPRWIVGNLFDMPSDSPWMRFAEWSELYGEITYVEVFGQPIVILNSLSACKELLEKRGATSSGRPIGIMHELMNMHKVRAGLTSMQDDPFWRYERRLTHAAFGPQSVQEYYPIQEAQSVRFLQKLLEPDVNCKKELRYAIGQTLFEVAYGLSPEQYFDEFMEMSDTLLRSFLEATIPGRFLVETIPILRYFPSWLPGAGFKRYAEGVSKVSDRHSTIYFEMVKRAWVSLHFRIAAALMVTSLSIGTRDGSTLICVYSTNMSAQGITLVPWIAGIDTTDQTVAKFMIAMQTHPDAQRKAQEELDRVVGTERLPTIADRDNLPYLHALIKEVLRWHPGVATGIPHRLTQDEVYKGSYLCPQSFIPRFSQRCRNIARQANDGTLLTRPDEFIPERFLDTDPGFESLPDPSEIVFGFGRRICPGRHVADGTVFLMISRLLATYWISSPQDNNGQCTDVHIDWSGVDAVRYVPMVCLQHEAHDRASYPNPMAPRFTPRSPGTIDLIKVADTML
ncbi:cytochrome P450 [Exidia glandulosa HHB12029]|uniref:Cytochrome P450 n=1 Tax=Exidia glandulosa HHB12029 TaxID=1314781 RepID=A0A165ZHQ8_EXIGL|nr:cytochrome P450 [Exidia glandulosa HHB12029]